MKQERILDIRETIQHMEKENLVTILEKIYDEYPTIRHSMYRAFIKAIGEKNEESRKRNDG